MGRASIRELAVGFPGIAHELCLDAVPFDGAEHLFGLSDRHPLVVLAVDEGRRRFDVLRELQRRAAPPEVEGLPGRTAESLFGTHRTVGRSPERDPCPTWRIREPPRRTAWSGVMIQFVM